MSSIEVHSLAFGTRLTLRAGTCVVLGGEDVTLVDPGAMDGTEEIDLALRPHGLALADVTRVFYTHLHFDHYAGTVFDEHVREVAMPRAEYAFTRRLMALRHDREAYRAMLQETHEHIAPVFLRQFVRLADDPRYDFDRPELQDRLRLVEPGEQIGAGIVGVDLAGHCPGQLGLLGHSQHGETLVAGDAVLSLEDWSAPDTTHLLIAWNRRRLLEKHRQMAGMDCLIPSHGRWFRPADHSLIPLDGE